MGLDGIGQSPPIKPGGFEKLNLKKLTVQGLDPISDSGDSGDSGESGNSASSERQNSEENPERDSKNQAPPKERLGRILKLIKNTGEVKSEKKQPEPQKKNPYKKYLETQKITRDEKRGAKLNVKI